MRQKISTPARIVDSSSVATLVYDPERTRRSGGYIGRIEAGICVIEEVLSRGGICVSRTSAECASRFSVILVSLTSTWDQIAFLRAVKKWSFWKRGKRPFKVVVGGFGLQNITPIRDYVDFAAYGRAEDCILDLVSNLLSGKDVHTSLSLVDMSVWSRDQKIKIRQPSKLFCGKSVSETFIGCRQRCLFCHYSWSRKPLGNSSGYVQGDLSGGASPELMWKDLIKIDKKHGRIRTAIDGSTYGVRKLYGKPITDEEIVSGIEHVGSFPGTTTLMVYNIVGFPGDTLESISNLESVISQANPRNRVIVVVHSTPFRPSPATPLQWAEANIDIDWSAIRSKCFVEKPRLRGVHSFTIETPYSLLRCLAIERATESTDELIDHILRHPKCKGNHDAAIRFLRKRFDLSQYTREYSVDEYPCGNVDPAVSLDKLRSVFSLTTDKAVRDG